MMTIDDIVDAVFLNGIEDIAPYYPKNSVHCVCIDPPYGVNFKDPTYDDSEDYVFSNFGKWLRYCYEVMVEHGYIFIFVPVSKVDVWIAEVRRHFTYVNLLTFPVYTNNRFSSLNNFGFNAQHVIVATKGVGKKINKVDWVPTSRQWFGDPRNKNPKEYTYCYPNVFPPKMVSVYGNRHDYHVNTKANGVKKRDHNNEKNPAQIQKFIEITTDVGDIVADFFMGSGTTAIACIDCGRHYTGCEKNAENHETAVQRIFSHYEKISDAKIKAKKGNGDDFFKRAGILR